MSNIEGEELSIYDLVMEERKFLHEMSNKLVVAQGMSKMVYRKMEENGQSISFKEVDRLGKAVEAIEKMVDLLRERRDRLHILTEKEKKNL